VKPETLTLINVGPFPGRHDIDFSSLGEIFLIFGKTGAGKTTIFDSIAYALYGELPGSRKGLVKQMRSQFSLDEEASSVTLVFTIGSRKYRATRVLPGERIGKRTGKVQQTAEESSLDDGIKDRGPRDPRRIKARRMSGSVPSSGFPRRSLAG
jgi:exonuclease SbcC